MEVDRTLYYSYDELYKIGWIMSMVKKHLPQPVVFENKCHKMSRYYLKTDVEKAMRLPEIASEIENNLKSRELRAERRTREITPIGNPNKSKQLQQLISAELERITVSISLSNIFNEIADKRKIEYIFENQTYYDNLPISSVLNRIETTADILIIAALIRISKTFPQFENECRNYIGEIIIDSFK